MENSQNFFHIGLTAPNFMVACIDGTGAEGGGGRLYSCYSLEPAIFSDQYQLLLLMEQVMESINYPQASVELRNYGEKEEHRHEKPKKVVEQRELLNNHGKKATYAIRVQYRQKATWQGEIVWVEKDIMKNFTSELEMLKLMDHMRED